MSLKSLKLRDSPIKPTLSGGDGSYSSRLYYNALGQVAEDQETYQGEAWNIDYDYDSLGRVASITYPATAAATRLKVNYAYDGSGALASVTDAHDGTVYWQQTPNAPLAVENAWGAMQAWTLGSGTEVARSHSGATGAVSTIQAGPNGEATRVNLSYSYDALGNVTHTNAALVGVSRTLGYDQFNRYTDETITNPNAPGGLGRGTGYSAGGNINWRTLVGSYDYGENGAPPHAVTTITHQGDLSHYAYDAAGRMTSGGALSAIDWNWSGQVRHLGGTPNVYLHYTPDGELLTKGVDGEGTARYFGKLFVQLGDGGWRERIVAAGEVIAIVNVSSAGYPSVDYRIADNLGSTAAIVNASGVLEGRYAWNMWGELVNPATYNGSDPDADAKEALTTLGYTGHEMFWKAGLVHTHVRLYMPGTGRWLSPDPIVPNLYNGQSLNRYSYVLNNPLTLTDPLGLADDFTLPPSCSGMPIPTNCSLPSIPVPGHCDIDCQAARLASQGLALWITNGTGSHGVGIGRGGGGGSGSRGSNNSNNQQQSQQDNHCPSSSSQSGPNGNEPNVTDFIEPFGGGTALLFAGGYAALRGPATVAAIARASTLTELAAESAVGAGFGFEVLAAGAVGGGIGVALGTVAYGSYHLYKHFTPYHSVMSGYKDAQPSNDAQQSSPACGSGL